MIDLEQDDAAIVSSYLSRMNWIDPARSVSAISRAGEGNMNITRRVQLDNHDTLILKQSVPYVAKYPDIPAPLERSEMEAAFYRATVSTAAVARLQPRLLGQDPVNHLIALEDLGESADFTNAYETSVLDVREIDLLLGYLSRLHDIAVAPGDFCNLAMRRLNHDHLFVIPLNKHYAAALDEITQGLTGIANQLAEDEHLVTKTLTLGLVYLGQKDAGTPALLHGDFFPGSWLRHADTGIRVIDPEFGFYGPAEFDLGVLVAHCMFVGIDVTPILERIKSERPTIDDSLVRAFAGVELIRRLIGVAQLPLSRSLEQKQLLLTTGVDWIKGWSLAKPVAAVA